MSHPTLFSYPRPRVDIAEVPAVSHAGAVLLTDTLHSTGLAHSLREALDPWTKPLAEHHAAKVLLDLAMTLTVGGEVARDTDLLRCEPGPVRARRLVPDDLAHAHHPGRRRPGSDRGNL